MVILGAILTKRMAKEEVRKNDGNGSEYTAL
jgi:hypothetical protein